MRLDPERVLDGGAAKCARAETRQQLPDDQRSACRRFLKAELRGSAQLKYVPSYMQPS
jgi:hypothetical protein